MNKKRKKENLGVSRERLLSSLSHKREIKVDKCN